MRFQKNNYMIGWWIYTSSLDFSLWLAGITDEPEIPEVILCEAFVGIMPPGGMFCVLPSLDFCPGHQEDSTRISIVPSTSFLNCNYMIAVIIMPQPSVPQFRD